MKFRFYQDLQIVFETLIYASYTNEEQGKILRLHQVQDNFRVFYFCRAYVNGSLNCDFCTLAYLRNNSLASAEN
jgi:hypothetical protein